MPQTTQELDRAYMKIALQLAQKGMGWTSPNPMVGAVVVKDGRIIGQGWHERCGGPHGERNALDSCRESPRGGTLYVTLEPCCHQGRQPPCTQAILKAGIRRVVIGAGDPNPLVSGKGIGILRREGVQVTEHILEEECRRLNRIFFHYIETRRPYVILKYAMTLDGKIAASTGASHWITGPQARYHVQRMRHRCSAVLVGVGTVLADDPRLTCRFPGLKSPLRIVCDTHLRTPLTSRVVTTARQVPTLLATCCRDPGSRRPYEEAGCRVLVLEERQGQVDLEGLMERLGREGIDSVLLEGGGALAWSALEQGIVQKIQAYIAPKLLGGRDAKTPVEGPGVPVPGEAFRLGPPKLTRLGEDLLWESEVVPRVHRDC